MVRYFAEHKKAQQEEKSAAPNKKSPESEQPSPLIVRGTVSKPWTNAKLFEWLASLQTGIIFGPRLPTDGNSSKSGSPPGSAGEAVKV